MHTSRKEEGGRRAREVGELNSICVLAIKTRSTIIKMRRVFVVAISTVCVCVCVYVCVYVCSIYGAHSYNHWLSHSRFHLHPLSHLHSLPSIVLIVASSLLGLCPFAFLCVCLCVGRL